jgi:hypothetical protein
MVDAAGAAELVTTDEVVYERGAHRLETTTDVAVNNRAVDICGKHL